MAGRHGRRKNLMYSNEKMRRDECVARGRGFDGVSKMTSYAGLKNSILWQSEEQ